MEKMMNKTTHGSHFKLNKTAKRILATIIDPHQRGHIKRMEIDAQEALQRAKLSKPRDNKD
jgi:hypothetical protein